MHNNTKFYIVHWNRFKLTSIRIEEVNFFLKNTKTDILCLNEIKLNNFELRNKNLKAIQAIQNKELRWTPHPIQSQNPT